jgi:hypothetical protein
VFDPERDQDPGARHFYARLLAIAAIAALGCVALWPSVTTFAAGPDGQSDCLAIKDGWHFDRSGPSAAQLASADAAIPPMPTEAQRNDPAFMARWRVAWQAGQSSPAVTAANARLDWLAGSGACVPASRHRLIETGIGLGVLVTACTAVALVHRARTRKNLRRFPAELAGT